MNKWLTWNVTIFQKATNSLLISILYHGSVEVFVVNMIFEKL